MELKILHLSVARGFPGMEKQLAHEEAAAREIVGAQWVTLGYIYTDSEYPFIKKVPLGFRGAFRRKLFAWIWLLRYSRNYDFVLLRHMPFDPFVVAFSWFVRNRILVFHSKNEEELLSIRSGWKGQAASKMEAFSGRLALRTATGLLGVTREIAEYHRVRRNSLSAFPVHVYPNGIRLDDIRPLQDCRSDDVVEIAFMAGSFAEWHGLDLLVDAFRAGMGSRGARKRVRLHVIGGLNADQLQGIDNVNTASQDDKIVVHGVLGEHQYREIFARCHLGIGSLAMYRNGLSEGATLKVREMLAMGVPVYSGHQDAALPADFPYYRVGEVSLTAICGFAERNTNVARSEVRDAAHAYIEKRDCMQSVVHFLERCHSK